MTNRDGSITPRAERAAQIARSLNREPTWTQQLTTVPADIALLDPKLARIVAAGEGDDSLVVESQLGAYSLIRSFGYAVDIVHEDEILDGLLERYKVLVIPFGYSMNRQVANLARSWVRDGGYLVGGIRCGAKDEFGYGEEHVPGLGLHEVFGAEEEVLTPVESSADPGRQAFSKTRDERAGMTVLTVVDELLPGAWAAGTFSGVQYVSTFRCLADADVIATTDNGHPVIVRNRFGVGQALLIGTFMRCPESRPRDDTLARLLADFVAAAGVTAPAVVLTPDTGEIEAEVLRGPDGRRLLVLLNAVNTAADVTVEVRGQCVSATDFESGKEYNVMQKDSSVLVELGIDGRDAVGILLA